MNGLFAITVVLVLIGLAVVAISVFQPASIPQPSPFVPAYPTLLWNIRVTDAVGTPLSGALINFIDPLQNELVTDSEGKVSILVPQGVYLFRLSHSNCPMARIYSFAISTTTDLSVFNSRDPRYVQDNYDPNTVDVFTPATPGGNEVFTPLALTSCPY